MIGMAMTGLDTFNTTVKKSNEWLKEIMKAQRWRDRQRASYIALRSVLHALRDRLIVDEAVHLHPVPVLLWSKYCRSDGVKKFDERACMSGGLGPRIPAVDLMPLALANAQRFEKFGA
jgi:hypothetical protein